MNDDDTQPTMAEWLRRSLSAHRADFHVAYPGRIETYDLATQKATVQPLIKHEYRDESDERQTEALAIITEVPVMFPGSGDHSMTWPVAKGDTGLLIFSSASLDRWLVSGGLVDPGDPRRNALSDAVFVLGLRPFNHAVPGDGRSSEAMVLAAPQLRLGGSNETQPTFMADSFMSALGTLLNAVATAVGGIVATSGGDPVGVAAGAAITSAFISFQTSVASSGKTLIARVK